MKYRLRMIQVLMALLALVLPATAQNLPRFDFTQTADTVGWVAAHDVSTLQSTPEGLVAAISGGDPYITGPARTFPSGQLLWLRLRLKSEQSGSCQVFFYTVGPAEDRSVRFNVPAGQWVEGRVPIPALGAGYKFRIDPPGIGGKVTLASLGFEARGAFPDIDFTTIPDGSDWVSAHDSTILSVGTNGLPIQITGADPYIFGPAKDYLVGQPMWLNLRIRSAAGGNAQLFYFQTGPSEDQSVRFYVPAGDWANLRIPVPSFGPATKLRFDPPGGGGLCELARMRFEARSIPASPSWPKPPMDVVKQDSPVVFSGDLSLVQGGKLGAFEVRVSGVRVAVGNARSLLGYVSGNTPRWLELTNPVSLKADGNALTASLSVTDPDGATWIFNQRFEPSTRPGGIEVTSSVSVNQERSVVFLPMISLFPGLGTFGTNKTQAVLAGIEYLDDEPSSSEADVIGPGARRQVPDSLKLAFPLMALSASGKYVGLVWEQKPSFAALHDSPDRIFHSGGHVMSLIFPGAAPETREDGSVMPYGGEVLAANQLLTLKATIIGGAGDSVVPAVQQYVDRRGLPLMPQTGYSSAGYFNLEAHGWLDSQIRDGFKFRHAVGGAFTSAAVADAPMFMDWLATKVSDPDLAGRLTNTARGAIALVPAPIYSFAGVGHVRHPTASLVYGSVAENAATALADGRGQLGLFQPDGSVLYQAPVGGLDLGKTHWAKDANGLTATHVTAVLERALFSGDKALMSEGLRLLRALDKFKNTVPRGAQTWEVPLHTPDILGSAYMACAYTIGYEITGDAGFLEQARYWAWTGVPFVYLTPPTDRPVGVYSTTPVFGATQFVAPLWIGLPVQWCGLVYGDVIRRLALHDPQGPWIPLANGIAAAGIQHTHTAAEPDYQGLLPDSYDLRAQSRNPVPINPATLLPEALQFFGEAPTYDYAVLRHQGLIAHAPGQITEINEFADRVSFKVTAWPKSPWRILINGFQKRPRVRVNGRDVLLILPHQYQDSEGRLILQLKEPSAIEIFTNAKDAVQIQKRGLEGDFRVSWPLDAANSVLESAYGLGNPTVWQTVEAKPVIDGDQFVSTLSSTQPAAFFRLRGNTQ